MIPGQFASLARCSGALLLAACMEIPEPGIQVGDQSVQRVAFGEALDIGEIQNITRLPVVPEDGGDIWVGGEQGCVRLARDGSVRGRVVFDRRIVNPVPIDVDGDGLWETMNGGEGWSDVGLVDATGTGLWGFPRGEGAAADAMAAGPIGNDGALAFLVGLNAGGGIHILDVDGEPIRSFPASNVFSVAVADLDDDGEAEMLHTEGGGFGGKIRVRDAQGSPVRLLDVDFNVFSLIRWPEPHSPLQLLGIDDGETVQIVDPRAEPEGRLLAEYELPDEGFGDGVGVLVRPAPGAPPWLAVARTIRATWHRSALYVFDSERQLVYHEIFPVSDIGLAAVPARDVPDVPEADAASADGAQALLVGVDSQVWRYSIQPQTKR